MASYVELDVLRDKLHTLHEITGVHYAEDGSFKSETMPFRMFARKDPTPFADPKEVNTDKDFGEIVLKHADETTTTIDKCVVHSDVGDWTTRFFSTDKKKRGSFELALESNTSFMFDPGQQAVAHQLPDGQVILAGQSLDDATGVALPEIKLNLKLETDGAPTPVSAEDRDFASRPWNSIIAKYCAGGDADIQTLAEHDLLCIYYRIQCYDAGESGAEPNKLGDKLFVMGTPKNNPLPADTATIVVEAIPSMATQRARTVQGIRLFHGGDGGGDEHGRGGAVAHSRGGIFGIDDMALLGIFGMHTASAGMAAFWGILFLGALLFLMAKCISFFREEAQRGTGSNAMGERGTNVVEYGGMGLCMVVGMLPWIWPAFGGTILTGSAMAFGLLGGTLILHESRQKASGGGSRTARRHRRHARRTSRAHSAGGEAAADQTELIYENQRMIKQQVRGANRPKKPTTYWQRLNQGDDGPVRYYGFHVLCKTAKGGKAQRMMPWILEVQSRVLKDRDHFVQNQVFSQTWQSMVNFFDKTTFDGMAETVVRLNTGLQERIDNAKDKEAEKLKCINAAKSHLGNMRKQYRPLWNMFHGLISKEPRAYSSMNLFKLVDAACCSASKADLCSNAIKLLQNKFGTSKANLGTILEGWSGGDCKEIQKHLISLHVTGKTLTTNDASLEELARAKRAKKAKKTVAREGGGGGRSRRNRRRLKSRQRVVGGRHQLSRRRRRS
jgi:hypothetical protein